MGKLNWNIGSVGPKNDALVTGAISDIGRLTESTVGTVANIFTPTVTAIVDNTATLFRKPYTTLGTRENYGKLAQTVPAIPMDIAMKTIGGSVSVVDNILRYGVNNNLERFLEGTKSLTTGLVSNIITNNGNTRFKTLKAIGAGVEGIGDLITTVIKTPTGALAAGTSLVDKYTSKGMQWTDKFLKGVRLSDKSFINGNFVTHSGDTPTEANTSRVPTKDLKNAV